MKHTEDDEQIAFFSWLSLAQPKINQVTWHTPNGGLRRITEAARLRRMGVKPGVPDIICMHPSGPYHALCIEMKRPIVKGQAKPVLTHDQKDMLVRLSNLQYYAIVCYGADEAVGVMTRYLAGKLSNPEE